MASGIDDPGLVADSPAQENAASPHADWWRSPVRAPWHVGVPTTRVPSPRGDGREWWRRP